MSAGSTTSMQEARTQSLSKMLEAVTKGSVVVIAILYGLGLLVSNEYLISIGVSDFTSVRPKYVLTGTWVLFLAAAASIPTVLPIALRLQRPAEKIAGITVGAVIAYGILEFAGVALRIHEFKDIAKPLILLLCVSFAVYLQTWAIWKLATIPAAFLAAATILLACFGGITATFIIARGIYPKVPEALGGGKPLLGRIILNKEGAEFWRDAGVEKSDPTKKTDDTFEDTARSRSAKILYQDEHVMVIEVQTTRVTPKLGEPGEVKSTQTRTILLNKSLVDAVIIDSTWKY
jgi:hypothetical protein